MDTHYAIVKEILTSPNPKDLYVEWPLASNVAEAEELVELAEKAGVRTAVGLQGRFEENMEDVKQILESGRIGDVLSVRVEGAMGDIGQISHYFVNNKVGGNYGTIFMGHRMLYSLRGGEVSGPQNADNKLVIDTILSVVGEIKSYQSVTANQIPKWNLPTEGVVDKDTLDHFSFHGFLKSGAFFDIFFRSGKAFNPEKSITWSIYGTKGEIEITGNILIPSGGPVAIKVKDEKGNIEELPLKGQRSPDVNIGKVYEAFRVSDERVVDFKEALKRHRFLEAIGSYSRESSRFGGNVEVK